MMQHLSLESFLAMAPIAVHCFSAFKFPWIGKAPTSRNGARFRRVRKEEVS